MSEFQYVAFRAIDRPVGEKNLEYMQRQSTRAEITPWSFENEYHYSDFRGNALEMLRRGYDIHLHYANFGIRKMLIRLPQGFPDASAAKPYLVDRSLCLLKDKEGRGGALCIEPSYEPGELEDLWDIGELIDRLVPLRAEILDGDLRPLYLAHLAVSCDCEHDPEETHEAPIPAGLEKLSVAQRALAEFYGLSDALIAAAAQAGPPVATRAADKVPHAEWIRGQSEARKNHWLAQLLADANSTVRADILAEFRSAQPAPLWPTVCRDRTIAQLHTSAEEIGEESNRKAAASAARRRAKKLAGMAADPSPTLRETERLVGQRSVVAYRQVAELLADLREALVGTDRSGLAAKQALELKKKNPTLNGLTSELRKNGFVPK